MTAAISTAIVRLFSEWVGRGPTKARTVIADNIVTCILEDSLTRAENRLVHEGGVDAIMRMRRTYQGTMPGDLIEAVEEITGRRVIAFLSDHQVQPDFAAEVFVLASDEGRPEDTQGGPETGRSGRRAGVDEIET